MRHALCAKQFVYNFRNAHVLYRLAHHAKMTQNNTHGRQQPGEPLRFTIDATALLLLLPLMLLLSKAYPQDVEP